MTARRNGRRWLVTGAVAAGSLAATVMPADATLVFPPVPAAMASVMSGDLTGYQWALAASNTPQAWGASTGTGVKVAVVDTGVDATNPDLAGQVLDGARWMWDRTAHKLVLQTATVAQTDDDWYGHGSHVSGIIAGKRDGSGITGVAPDAKILPVQMLTRSAYNHLSDVRFLHALAASVRWANTHGAQVVNLSLGAPISGITQDPGTQAYLSAAQAVCKAVKAVTAAGTLVVASAGNDGAFDNPANVPATCPGALTVAATSPSQSRTYWSSFDGDVRIAAPGESLLSVASTVAFGPQMRYVEESGTSMSAPMVSGAAALVFAQHPGWSADQVANRLTATAQDHGLPGRDAEYGYGLLDSAAAVGVSAPALKPADVLITAAMPFQTSFDYDFSKAMLSWNVLAVHAVTSYTIRVYGADGSVTDTSVAGNAVRAPANAAHGDWLQVIAHTTAGDVASWPVWWLDYNQLATDSTPPPLRQMKATRGPKAMTVTWAAPAASKRSLFDLIEVDVMLGLDTFLSRTVPVRAGRPFPTQVRLPLPPSAKWADAEISVGSINGTQFSPTVVAAGAMVPGGSPALFGMNVAALHRAGAKAFEVTASVSAMHAKKVCHNRSCVGRRVRIAVRRPNGQVQATFGRLTSEGLSHVLIWVPRGSTGAVLKVTGPGGLTSGPFRRIRLSRSGGFGFTGPGLVLRRTA